jgi:hypothetical protein
MISLDPNMVLGDLNMVTLELNMVSANLNMTSVGPNMVLVDLNVTSVEEGTASQTKTESERQQNLHSSLNIIRTTESR